MKIKQNYYRTLEIPTNANEEQIKLAYRRLVKHWHPDVNGNSPESQEKLKAINEAYEILSDKTARGMYNNTIAANEEARNSASGVHNTKEKTETPEEFQRKERVRSAYENRSEPSSEYYTKFEKIINQYKDDRCDAGFFDKLNILYRDTSGLSPFQRMYLFMPLFIGAVFWHGCDVTSRGFCAIFDLFITK